MHIVTHVPIYIFIACYCILVKQQLSTSRKRQIYSRITFVWLKVAYKLFHCSFGLFFCGRIVLPLQVKWAIYISTQTALYRQSFYSWSIHVSYVVNCLKIYFCIELVFFLQDLWICCFVASTVQYLSGDTLQGLVYNKYQLNVF